MVSLMIDRIGYWYGPISAIILYGCNLGKDLNVLGNAINVTPQSHCDTYGAEVVSKRNYGMYLPGLCTHTQPCASYSIMLASSY